MAMKMKKGVLKNRRAFMFDFGGPEPKPVMVAVRAATQPVDLPLSATHIREAIKRKGQGDVNNCAMAVCSIEHGHLFPHKVEFVDWTYNRAYVVSKWKKGLPSECIVYQHNDNIAPLFDTDKGMKTLLKELDADGDRIVRLRPPRTYARPVGRPSGIKTGRTAARPQNKGAALRVTKRLQDVQLRQAA